MTKKKNKWIRILERRCKKCYIINPIRLPPQKAGLIERPPPWKCQFCEHDKYSDEGITEIPATA